MQVWKGREKENRYTQGINGGQTGPHIPKSYPESQRLQGQLIVTLYISLLICYFILLNLFDLYLNGKKVTEIKIYFSSPVQERQQ